MVCQSLELSTSQFAVAKERYEGVGGCLAGSDNPVLKAIAIYLQGSDRAADDREADRRQRARRRPGRSRARPRRPISPAALKKAIGDSLRANGNYAPLLEEMPRCWRLKYANEFHMDITPSIPNPNCRFGGELVPDKTLKDGRRRIRMATSACSSSAPSSLPSSASARASRSTARGRASSHTRRPAASRVSCAARCRSGSATAT